MAADGSGLGTQFKDFILRGNVVDLAVAVVIGAAFGALVTAFVEDLLTPIIAAIVGKPDFSSLTFTINDSRFLYGAFINTAISFVAIAVVVFLFVVKPVNAVLERRKNAIAAGAAPEPASVSDEALLLTEIRDLLRAQQGAS